MPLVSVIIPTYNNGRYIRQAVDSVLNQTYIEHEVIVIDDGSTDDTQQKLQHYKNRIQYVYQDNKGVSAARNLGIRKARGEFIVFLDADDFLLPNKITKQMACFYAGQDLGIVHSGWRMVDNNANLIKDEKPWYDATRLDLETWLLWKPVFLGAMMFRKEWLDRVGGFNTELRQAEDVDLIFRLSLMGCKAAWLYEPTVCYRKHENNTISDGIKQAEGIEMVLDNFFARPEVPCQIRKLENRVRYYTLLWSAWHLYCTGNREYVTSTLKKSLTYTKYNPRLILFDWIGQFAKQFLYNNREIEELRAILPYIKDAIQFDDIHWEQIKDISNWWIDVWWYYLHQNHKRAALGLEAYRKLTSLELVEMVKSCILMGHNQDIVNVITQFWQDVMAKQIIPNSSRHEVTALYLTIFGQAFLGHHWKVSLQALWMAIRSGLRPRAIAAWYRFFKAGFVYFCNRRGNKSNLHYLINI